MKVKVCGMRDADNIRALAELEPDYVGFIFYEGSNRYVGEEFDTGLVEMVPAIIKKVGVFVDSDLSRVEELVKSYGLDIVQLHGAESREYVSELKDRVGSGQSSFEDALGRLELWKAVAGDERLAENAKEYEGLVDCLLVDTPAKEHGGSGKKFDWSILKKAELKIPFFLSGGIGENDAEEVLGLELDSMIGVDINSRFEIEPGLKNIREVSTFINRIRHGK